MYRQSSTPRYKWIQVNLAGFPYPDDRGIGPETFSDVKGEVERVAPGGSGRCQIFGSPGFPPDDRRTKSHFQRHRFPTSRLYAVLSTDLI